MSDPNHKQKWHKIGGGRRVRVGGWTYIKNSHIRAWAKNKEQDYLAGIEKKIGKAGHVYIFSLGHDNFYKIGCTYDIQKRLRALQAGNPKMRCVWSAWVRDMKEAEKRLHEHFKRLKAEREVFVLEQKHIIEANGLINFLREEQSGQQLTGVAESA